MDPLLKAICFTIALLCFFLSALAGTTLSKRRPQFLGYPGWFPAGAFFFTLPIVWDAWELV